MDIRINRTQVETTLTASKQPTGTQTNLPTSTPEEGHLEIIKKINHTNRELNKLFAAYQLMFISHLEVAEKSVHSLVEKDEALSSSIRCLDGR